MKQQGQYGIASEEDIRKDMIFGSWNGIPEHGVLLSTPPARHSAEIAWEGRREAALTTSRSKRQPMCQILAIVCNVGPIQTGILEQNCCPKHFIGGR